MYHLRCLHLSHYTVVELSSSETAAEEDEEVTQTGGEEVTTPVAEPLVETEVSLISDEVAEDQILEPVPQAEPQVEDIPITESGMEAAIEVPPSC